MNLKIGEQAQTLGNVIMIKNTL